MTVRFTDDDRREIARAYQAGTSSKILAARFHCGPIVITRLLREMGVKIRCNGADVTRLSQEEIAARAAVIRDGWSPLEERVRRTGSSSRTRWTPPTIESPETLYRRLGLK